MGLGGHAPLAYPHESFHQAKNDVSRVGLCLGIAIHGTALFNTVVLLILQVVFAVKIAEKNVEVRRVEERQVTTVRLRCHCGNDDVCVVIDILVFINGRFITHLIAY